MTTRGSAGIRCAAVAAAVVVAAIASLLRELLTSTGAALVLVLVVVAVSVAGDRAAGVLAALSAALSFDFFLTVPYYQFAIFAREDLETAILLLAIGVAVTEISLWGRRQQSQSGRREGYLAGVAHAARMAADGYPTEDLVATVGRMINDVLDLDDTRYEPVERAHGGATRAAGPRPRRRGALARSRRRRPPRRPAHDGRRRVACRPQR